MNCVGSVGDIGFWYFSCATRSWRNVFPSIAPVPVGFAVVGAPLVAAMAAAVLGSIGVVIGPPQMSMSTEPSWTGRAASRLVVVGVAGPSAPGRGSTGLRWP